MSAFACDQCGETKSHPDDSISTGYAKNDKGQKICFACCAGIDRQSMIDHGHSKHLPLYFTPAVSANGHTTPAMVHNWPGTLSFRVRYTRKGKHNMAGTRLDVWFNGPDGFIWHGTQYGEWTDIIHSKRTKERNGGAV